MKHSHEFRDPIHTFIAVRTDERKVIDSRPFQRLRHIHQLALSYLVYPGAKADPANLLRFQDAGGKIIFWQGASDNAITVNDTIRYYTQLAELEHGGFRKTQDFARFFIGARHFAKGGACAACALTEGCGGISVAEVRALYESASGGE